MAKADTSDAAEPVERFRLALDMLQTADTRAKRRRAAHQVRECAELGNIDAQWWWGYMLRHGHGTRKNPRAAVGWLRAAAERGHPEAKFELGSMLKVGEGVQRNRVRALGWLLRAADQGDEDAKLQAMRLQHQLRPEQVERTRRWAASQGGRGNRGIRSHLGHEQLLTRLNGDMGGSDVGWVEFPQ